MYVKLEKNANMKLHNYDDDDVITTKKHKWILTQYNCHMEETLFSDQKTCFGEKNTEWQRLSCEDAVQKHLPTARMHCIGLSG